MAVEFIKRNYPAEFRAIASSENDGIIEGIPIVFDTPTDIGGYFEEEIKSGAISKSVLENDVRFFWNHNINEKALARSVIPIDKKGGMEFDVNKNNISMRVNINRQRTDANDMFLAIEDGTVNAMSFMFAVEEERWERENTDYPKRIITKISPVVEVSAVNFPAYKTTSINTRADLSTEIDKRIWEEIRSKGSEETLPKNELQQNIKNLIYQYGGKVK